VAKAGAGANQARFVLSGLQLAVMQANGENDEDTCAYNDLALIKLNPADVANVNPSVPGFGGPTGMGSWGGTGSTVYTYGNSSLRGGVAALSPKQGIAVQNSPEGCDLPKELAYMRANAAGLSGVNLRCRAPSRSTPNVVGAVLKGLGL
jgi:hypothetical protein